jgi:hypothetical protein
MQAALAPKARNGQERCIRKAEAVHGLWVLLAGELKEG